MLRVSATTGPGAATITLEGRLAGPWVDEVRTCWRRLVATRDARPVRIDLEAVTFVDPAGKALLWAMREQGAVLVASGCMMRAMVEEIEKTSHERGSTVAEKGEN